MFLIACNDRVACINIKHTCDDSAKDVIIFWRREKSEKKTRENQIAWILCAWYEGNDDTFREHISFESHVNLSYFLLHSFGWACVLCVYGIPFYMTLFAHTVHANTHWKYNALFPHFDADDRQVWNSLAIRKPPMSKSNEWERPTKNIRAYNPYNKYVYIYCIIQSV